jgi:hypothetical protein
MNHERTREGGLKLEFSSREALLLRYLAERATFVDTPPEEQDAIFDLAERILAALGQRSDS